MKFEVKKIDGSLSFEAEIECRDDETYGIKLGLAIHWGYKNKKDLKYGDYKGAVFKNLKFYDSTFDDLRFDGSTFDGSRFDDSTFDGSRFVGSTFYDSTFDGSKFVGSRFDDSTFDGSTFYGSRFDGSRFYDSTFYDSTFDDLRFDGSRFVDSRFVGSRFVGSTFYDSTFDGSKFDGSMFYGSTFDGSRFVDSTFYGSMFYGSTFDGSTFDEKTIRNFKHDFWAILLRYRNEVPKLIEFIREGKIDGSCYSGECSCLMGTIATIKNLNIDDIQFDIKNLKSPAEIWFMMIKEGDTPETNEASRLALEWAEEFLEMIK